MKESVFSMLISVQNLNDGLNILNEVSSGRQKEVAPPPKKRQ